MKFRHSALTVLLVIVCARPGVAGAEDEAPLPARVPLPLNVAIDEEVRNKVEEIVAISPTLRRQLAAISGAPTQIAVRVSPASLSALRRAETSISRYGLGLIKAVISVAPGRDFVELLAHELEHVVEQIEGVDLPSLVRSGAARRDRSGVFETTRAHEAGRAAAAEAQAAARR